MKRITSIFLTLVLTLCLVGNAFAAGTETTFTPNSSSGVTVGYTWGDKNDFITLTISGLTSGNQYLILMVSGSFTDLKDAPQITESNIKYIDQASSEGNLEFKVYPSSMQDSTILLSGSGMDLTILGTVRVPYKLGDLTGDQEVDSRDAVSFNRHLAKINIIDGNALLAADVTKDGVVDSRDVVKLNRYLAKILDTLE